MISQTFIKRRIANTLTRQFSTKSVLVPVAGGSEEIETISVVDILRRAGAEVTLAKVEKDWKKKESGDLKCLLSRGITIMADKALTSADVQESRYDAIVLPGGLLGSLTMAKN